MSRRYMKSCKEYNSPIQPILCQDINPKHGFMGDQSTVPYIFHMELNQVILMYTYDVMYSLEFVVNFYSFILLEFYLLKRITRKLGTK